MKKYRAISKLILQVLLFEEKKCYVHIIHLTLICLFSHNTDRLLCHQLFAQNHRFWLFEGHAGLKQSQPSLVDHPKRNWKFLPHEFFQQKGVFVVGDRGQCCFFCSMDPISRTPETCEMGIRDIFSWDLMMPQLCWGSELWRDASSLDTIWEWILESRFQHVFSFWGMSIQMRDSQNPLGIGEFNMCSWLDWRTPNSETNLHRIKAHRKKRKR